MSEKLPVKEIIRIALIWADESMLAMVHGCDEKDPYRTEVLDQLKQLRAYYKHRFGKRRDPFEGAEFVSLATLRKQD